MAIGVELFSGPKPFKISGGIDVNEVVSTAMNSTKSQILLVLNPLLKLICNFNKFKVLMKRVLVRAGKYVVGPFLAGAAAFIAFKYIMYKSNLTMK